MKNYHWLKRFALALSLLMLVCACDDEPEPEAEIDLQTMQDVNVAEIEFDDVIQLAEDVQDGVYDGRNGRVETCAVVTLDVPSSTVTVDFGDGCEGLDGRVRKGKIIVHYQGQPRTPGAETTATFEDFFIEDHQIRGTVKNHGFTFNANGNLEHNQTVTGGELIFPDGTNITFENSRKVEWTKGIATLFDFSDDEFSITGSGSGINRENLPYQTTITTALIAKPACWLQGIFYPASGEIRYDIAGFQIFLDYGSGACDKVATASLNDLTVTVNLP